MMKNNIENIDNCFRDCTSCGACSAVCPVKAIKMALNTEGFYRPAVNNDLCISCGKCKKVCYKYDAELVLSSDPPLVCYSAKNKDKNELIEASSGAVSIELMRTCISLGYYVVGVAYDYSSDTAVTRIAKTESQLEQFRGSKYFQSFTQDAFESVINDKSNQKYAIFGTPCQIYAFSKMADLYRNKDKYLLIDIFCHGCPTLNLWSKYIDYQKQACNAVDIKKIRFRSKTYGWHEFSFDFIANKSYKSDKYNDPFYELFFGMDIMNPACYDCIPRSSIQKTDIRLGDFWGWQYDEDLEGVSAVVVNSKRGKEILEQTAKKFTLKTFKFEEIIAAQSYGKEHTYNAKRRECMIKLLSDKTTSIKEIQKKYRSLFPISHNLKRHVKNIIKHLPQRIYAKIRANMHKKTN